VVGNRRPDAEDVFMGESDITAPDTEFRDGSAHPCASGGFPVRHADEAMMPGVVPICVADEEPHVAAGYARARGGR